MSTFADTWSQDIEAALHLAGLHSEQRVESLQQLKQTYHRNIENYRHYRFSALEAQRFVPQNISERTKRDALTDHSFLGSNQLIISDEAHLSAFKDSCIQCTTHHGEDALGKLKAWNLSHYFPSDPFLSSHAATLRHLSRISVAPRADEKGDGEINLLLIHQHTPHRNGQAYISHALDIDVPENVTLNILELDASSSSEAALSHSVVRITQAENATVNYFRIQNTSEQQFHHHHLLVQQARESSSFLMALNLGAAQSRSDISVQLDGENAKNTTNGLYMAQKKTLHDCMTTISHNVSHTFSRELYKGILDDHGVGSFRGKIEVKQDAQKITSEQLNRSLLLSRNASANAIPQLEIYADDVKCAHGATIGELDPEELFYLRSRGYTLKEAQLALVQAFAQEVFEDFNLPAPWLELAHQLVAERFA